MTVLMFGWEFPPHISGGLGTACAGLTQALTEEETRVLFVVPKAHGDESFDLINASEIVIPEGEGEALVPVEGEESNESIRTIAIPSTLMPYCTSEPGYAIELWNWEFSREDTRLVTTPAGSRYEFTGKYGPGLMDEVHRYAEVSRTIASQNTFDVIHAHDWLTYLAGIEAKKITGKPLVIHVHATEFDRAGEKDIDQRVFEIEKKGMVEADLIIAVSQWTKDIIVDKYEIAESKIEVVHNGVIPAEINDLSLTPGFANPVVTFLGRITYQKGPRYFVDAARRVLDYFPDTHFIMAGSGDLLPAMMEYVAQWRLSSRIHFTGFLKEKQIQHVWAITDVYVMPSVSEPFGITPLEAAQAGVPVILSNQSGIAEVMDHAIKADFWDTDALANAIIGVLKYKGLSETLKTNSKKELRSLTWERAAKKINQLYHEL
jgi:glycogen synthase